MMLMKRVVASSILLCLCWNLVKALAVLTREYDFANTRLIIDGDSIENMTVSYALCDQDKTMYRRDCSIVLETMNTEGVIYADRCDVRLEINLEGSWISQEMRVSPFGSKKAILRWMEMTKGPEVLIKLRTITFPECTWTEGHIQDSKTHYPEKALNWLNLLIYQSKFDVAFRNSTACFRQRCKMRFDGDGGKMLPASPWLKVGPFKNVDVKPIALRSPEQGFFVTMSDLTGTNVTVVYDNGIPKDYATISMPHERVVSSTAHGILGLCAVASGSPQTALCKQFNRFGKGKLDTEVSLGYDPRELALYNLFKGGLLLLTSSTRGGYSYYITKIGRKGQRFRSVQVTEFKCDEAREVKANFFESEPGTVCVSLLCMMDNTSSLVVKCLPDKILSVKY